VAGLVLLLAARGEGCSFSVGPNGLCASFRVNPEDTRVRVGDTFRVRINPDGCTAATGCGCGDPALEGASWTSGNPAAATVDSTGLVVARGAGVATIVLTPVGGSWSGTRVHVTVIP
jgi:uncharacterized protein YjdB